MKLLIPDGNVKDIAEFSGLNVSLLYMERRKSGKDLTATGTRNTIDRLDLFCEWNLDRNPDVVRLLGQRYLQMHRRHVAPLEMEVSVKTLLEQLGKASKEFGEAVATLSSGKSLRECQVEVADVKRELELALEMILQMEEK
jgi:hypothetical protein